jgi:LPS export ABC transporter protein LptC
MTNCIRTFPGQETYAQTYKDDPKALSLPIMPGLIMKNMGKTGRLPVAGSLLVLATLFLFQSCGNDIAEVEELVARFNTEVETVKNVEILYSDSARIKVRIAGPTMLNYVDRQEPRQEFPDGVVVDFFGPGNVIEATLTAKYGIRYQTAGKVTVRDSVVWKNIEQNKLETEELHWDERRQKIFTNKFVVITQPDEIIYGHGFEADPDLSHAQIRAIEGQIKVDDLQNERQ